VPGVVDQIRAWATQLAYWEQMALEMVATGKGLTEVNYQVLLDYCMQDAGLVQMPKRPKIEFSRNSASDTRATYRLERLFNLRNVNALPTGQELHFGPQLTVVYGDNGAGKTGYARPLGSAAFARGDRDVLPNAALPQNPNLIPQADIEVSQDGTRTVVTWTRGQPCAELQGFYVFDNSSLSIHLTRSNPLSISPAGLSLLTRLADVTDEVRTRFKLLLDQRDTTVDFAALFVGASAVSNYIQALGAQTDLEQLKELADLADEEQLKIVQLGNDIAQLKAQDIPNRVLSLRQSERDLRELRSSIEVSEQNLGAAVVSEVNDIIENLQNAKQDAESSGTEQFKSEFLDQVGTKVWREFVAAAKYLADAEAVRGIAYPSHDDRCILCRQPLSEEAIDLIQRLWGFLKSDSAARFEAAQASCVARIRELEQIKLAYFGEGSAVRRLLITLAPDLVPAIENQIAAYSARRVELITGLKEGQVVPKTVLAPFDAQQITVLIQSQDHDAEALEKESPGSKLKNLESALRELDHRRILSVQFPAIKAYIETKRWVATGRQSLGSTRNITAKYNELFQQLVTERFIELFQSSLSRFEKNLRISVETRGHKGETVRQIVLNREAYPASYPIDSVLSDGEKRAVALADFLTEAALDESCTGIILDDPVSSFDLGARKNLARYLTELARTRQVIVFTHDLVFLYELKTQAKDLSVGTVTHWVQRGHDGTPGMVFLENSPACEGDYKSSRLARERYTKAKTAMPQEQQWLLAQGFGALRTSYEAFIIFALFEGVVERFEERISFGRLKDVSLDPGIVKEVISRMETLSRYIDAHLHSDSFTGQKPGPDVLWAEIEAFDTLRKQHKQEKKAVHTAATETKSSAEEKSAMQEDAGPTISSESIELESRGRLANRLRPRN
jgi:energy-coupling factor transporter ATP-binding protein EcfA2